MIRMSNVPLLLVLMLPNIALAGKYIPAAPGAEVVPLEYVLSFDTDAKSSAMEKEETLASEALKEGFEIKETWRSAIHGAAIAKLSEDQAKALSGLPGVAIITPNVIGYSSGTQLGAPFGLDRIDQRNLPVNTTYNYAFLGTGVHAYVMDGGIRTTHVDFKSLVDKRIRATNDFDATGTLACQPGQFGLDHGTAVASIIGGVTSGVAKNVNIHGVRVSTCLVGATNLASMISGTNWVVSFGVRPAVVNYSTFVYDPAGLFAETVSKLINSGFFVASAIGNGGGDGCTTTPNNVQGVFVVGGSDTTDHQADVSNGGACMGAFAPVQTDAASSSDDTSFHFVGATSYSAPLGTGAAALLYESASPAIPSQAAMNAALIAHASHVITGTTYGAPDRLLYTGLPW